MNTDHPLRQALKRARPEILTIGLTYALSLAIGIMAVHAGVGFALNQRDKMVRSAVESSPILKSYRRGHEVRAALLDFSGNLLLGTIPNTAGGLAIYLPYPVVAYRGWIGGIVSVNSAHTSRLRTVRGGCYYIAVIILQLTPYTLAGGAGVYLGREWYRSRPSGRLSWWWPLPRHALVDVAWIYALVVPLLMAGSIVEFCW